MRKGCLKKLLHFQTVSSLWQLSDGIIVGGLNPVNAWSRTVNSFQATFIVERVKEVKDTLCTELQEESQAISSQCYSWGDPPCLCIDLVANWSRSLSGQIFFFLLSLVLTLHKTVEDFYKPEACCLPNFIAESPRHRASLHLHSLALQRCSVQWQQGLSFINLAFWMIYHCLSSPGIIMDTDVTVTFHLRTKGNTDDDD